MASADVEESGESPVLAWLQELSRSNIRALDACIARVKLLALMGHELRRPHADMLRDGIYEPRARVGNVNDRLLYFFHGEDIAVVAHASPRKRKCPAATSSGPLNGDDGMSKRQRNTKRRSTSDGLEILERTFVGTDPARREAADKAFEDAVIGQLIHDARLAAGLTQTQLAKMVGTDQAVISRLEDADYEGHSLTMLRRIAEALGKKLDIRFVDAA